MFREKKYWKSGQVDVLLRGPGVADGGPSSFYHPMESCTVCCWAVPNLDSYTVHQDAVYLAAVERLICRHVGLLQYSEEIKPALYLFCYNSSSVCYPFKVLTDGNSEKFKANHSLSWNSSLLPEIKLKISFVFWMFRERLLYEHHADTICTSSLYVTSFLFEMTMIWGDLGLVFQSI